MVRCRPVVAVIPLLVLAPGCGDPSRSTGAGADVAVDLGDVSELFHLSSVSTTVGSSSFLLAGIDADGGVAVVEAAARGEDPELTEPVALDAGIRPSEDSPTAAFEIGEGEWLVAPYGCDVVEGRCPSARAVFFRVSTRAGTAKRIADLPLDHGTLSFIGTTSSGDAVLEVGQNRLVVDGGSQGPPAASYESTIRTLDPATGAMETLPWRPPALTYSPVVHPGTVAADRPGRHVCAAADRVVSLDYRSAARAAVAMLTTVALTATSDPAEPVPLPIPEGSVPRALLCHADGSVQLVTLVPRQRRAAVQWVSSTGVLGAPQETGWSDDLVNLLTQRRSVVVISATRPTMTEISQAVASDRGPDELARSQPGPQLQVFVEGSWRPIETPALAGDQLRVTEDGRRVLIARGDRFSMAIS